MADKRTARAKCCSSTEGRQSSQRERRLHIMTLRGHRNSPLSTKRWQRRKNRERAAAASQAAARAPKRRTVAAKAKGVTPRKSSRKPQGIRNMEVEEAKETNHRQQDADFTTMKKINDHDKDDDSDDTYDDTYDLDCDDYDSDSDYDTDGFDTLDILDEEELRKAKKKALNSQNA